MKIPRALRWPAAVAVVVAMLAAAISFDARAQSEYMRGDRMPYDAFDRLPRTDLVRPDDHRVRIRREDVGQPFARGRGEHLIGILQHARTADDPAAGHVDAHVEPAEVIIEF